MLIRKPSILGATYSGLPFWQSSTPASSTTSPSSSPRERARGTRHRTGWRTRCPSYATYARDRGEDGRHEWPTPPKGQTSPTPYQIFAMNHDAVYSKARFYELVKLYHPDRPDSAGDAVPPAAKVERYRMIVAAHAILSDPVKRSAYDRLGAGWNGKGDVGRREAWSQGPAGPFSHSWHHPDDAIWRNATWEDWERFYAKRAREAGGADGVRQPQQAPVYFQNSYFFVLVMMLAFIGSSVNFHRAHDAGHYFVEQKDIMHDRTAKELRRVRQQAASGGREERVQWFLRNREATLGLAGSDPEALQQEKLDRMLPERQVCRSEEIAEKDE